MNENRPNFPKYLHGAIILVSIILGSFGIFGYLHFTDDIHQLISDNLQYGTLSIIVRLTLCIGILFTYPLQIYPVVEIFENLIFKETKARSALTSSFNHEYSSLLYDPMNVGANNYSGEKNEEDDSSETSSETDEEKQQELPPVSEFPVEVHRPKWHCDIFVSCTLLIRITLSMTSYDVAIRHTMLRH